MTISTPYYLIHEKKLLINLRKIKRVRDLSGAKSLLALKCFSSWCVFDLMSQYMDGTTSSSLFEVRLGFEKFGKETHAYSVAWAPNEISKVKKYADKVIFNSVAQLQRFYNDVKKKEIGVRVNPQISYSHFDLANPARKHSRLGLIDKKELIEVLPQISGVMFHFNCENDDFQNFSDNLDYVAYKYKDVLKAIEWVSLGGGIFFTKENYPVDAFCAKLKEFSKRFNVQIYLEPGEAAITQSTELITEVLDIVHNGIDIAIVNASIEAHMLDLLTYRLDAKIDEAVEGKHMYMVAGRSCLAGDIFGAYTFKNKLKPGSIVKISDAAGYTMVKKNWFNGLPMPSIAVKRLDGTVEEIRRFDYEQFLKSVS